MENFFHFTAWPMVPPVPYSAFHIILGLSGIILSLISARLLAGSVFSRHHSDCILFLSGLFLSVCELYKQGFLYTIVNSGRYDWWYFPFQLCSVPMYLCLLYPFLPSDRRHPIINKINCAVFIQDFGLLGGFMALADPSGLMHPYWTLTLHGFIWHFILIFLGFYCCFSRISDVSTEGFFRVLPLFFLCCIIATVINVAAGPDGNADMFYITPYYPSLQRVFHTIALFAGIIPGNIVYLFCVCLGAGLVHKGCRRLTALPHIMLKA